ncbi:carbon starvation protein CstA [Thermococcus litoralis DSM 5473]|uniref:Carbon starvation protein CstA n=1 Tax=Thermococcus litoralis (strain ATCC 51850 / DSM 5473 / JCM 8560 / NS-C) TaxID=523849 RepID=H3ZQU3_THELN|nr:carbon starvation protein A [Thermococcus litoralis]EHR77669.1 carbon starvation protein CstA [Thermococcus litoralis DSM 5473]
MNSAVIILAAAIVYVAMYFTYGKSLQSKVVKADPNRPTPAHKLYDGVDYVPAHPVVLYGHHFASIAGAGPITGPALAMAWGWIPSLLWVWFGNVFIGAVHDYLALMASVRYDGKSIQWIAGKIMSKRTGVAFEVYIWFTLLLVVAAFVAVTARLLVLTPEAATATLLFLLVAIILGWMMYKMNVNFYVATVIGLILLVVAVWIGFKNPLLLVPGQTDATSAAYTQAYHYWNIILMIYIIVASSLPVWVLLQPRDYLNAYILWFGLLIGGIAFIALAKPFEAPGFSMFSANVVGGQPSPFWPTVPLVIACGALSGFHSIVGSGTSSKQLDKEIHGLLVGYGGMFTEGFLSTIVITAIAVYGVKLTGLSANAVEWGTQYITKGGLGTFIGGYAQGLADFYGMDVTLGKTFATLWVSAFTLTSLDTATRLGRFAWQEVFGMVTDTSQGIWKTITNKWVASIVIAVLGTWMAWGASYQVLWPAFAGMNQLLASIAMLTAALWAYKIQKAGAWSYAVLIPALFLWITVTAGLIWYIIVVPLKGSTLIAVKGSLLVGLVLNFLLAYDFYLAWKRPAEEYEAAPA